MIILLLLLAMFIIGFGFAWVLTTSYYEQRIRQGEYFTPEEKEELAELQIGKDRWVWRGKHKMTKTKAKKLRELIYAGEVYAKKQRKDWWGKNSSGNLCN